MKYLDKYKREPILYNILLDIEILSTSNKGYEITLNHQKAKILRRYITKLQKRDNEQTLIKVERTINRAIQDYEETKKFRNEIEVEQDQMILLNIKKEILGGYKNGRC